MAVGLLGEDEVILELSKVAEYADLDADEIEKTIESGMEARQRNLEWFEGATRRGLCKPRRTTTPVRTTLSVSFVI